MISLHFAVSEKRFFIVVIRSFFLKIFSLLRRIIILKSLLKQFVFWRILCLGSSRVNLKRVNLNLYFTLGLARSLSGIKASF